MLSFGDLYMAIPKSYPWFLIRTFFIFLYFILVLGVGLKLGKALEGAAKP